MKKFEEAKIEVLKFAVEDVITESSEEVIRANCTGGEEV